LFIVHRIWKVTKCRRELKNAEPRSNFGILKLAVHSRSFGCCLVLSIFRTEVEAYELDQHCMLDRAICQYGSYIGMTLDMRE